MAKKVRARSQFVQGMGILSLLKDKDWITILSALIGDKEADCQVLAKSLLARTKHGRQVRLLKLIGSKKPKVIDMQKLMKVSRRTIFRDLNSLENYGIKLNIDDKYSYSIAKVPANFKRFV